MSKDFENEDKKYIDSGELQVSEELDKIDENVKLVEYLGEGNIIYVDEDGYYLEKEAQGRKGFIYTIFSPEDYLVYSWRSYNDFEKDKNFEYTYAYQIFRREIADYKKDMGELLGDAYDEEPEDLWGMYSGFERTPSYPVRHLPYYSSQRSYTPTPKKTGFFDELTKSNTLVFHRTDPTTTMLDQVYEGKGWDVIHDTYDLDREELYKVVDAHERIVCLGHGSSYGLIGMFGPEMAPHFKDKKLFIIWCNADKYFESHGVGKGCFVTKNAPSEVWECAAAGCGHISKELMLENITYWSKLCADVVEECLEGNPQKGVDYIRKHYLEQYGNHPVTIFNADSAHVLGTNVPLPKYEFKGKHLEPIDYPILNFDEEAFLKHPTAIAKDCPTKIN